MVLSNGNTQFALEICRELKTNYSIPTVALQITSYFFHKKCYVNHDRFMIILGAIILSNKLKHISFRIKDIAYAFYKVINYHNNSNEPYNEKKLAQIRN